MGEWVWKGRENLKKERKEEEDWSKEQWGGFINKINK